MEESLDIEQVILSLETDIVSAFRDKKIVAGTIQFQKNTTVKEKLSINCCNGSLVELSIPKGIGMNDLIRYIYYRLHQLFTIALLGEIRHFQMKLDFKSDKTG
ncbi:MAG: hypothetical protein NT116_06585, partial [Candidatus Parcubacteria bacterium]|nr:hypothetical protein [Candidatus Parcubacteria bacterium]